jgi:hypothetical protein
LKICEELKLTAAGAAAARGGRRGGFENWVESRKAEQTREKLNSHGWRNEYKQESADRCGRYTFHNNSRYAAIRREGLEALPSSLGKRRRRRRRRRSAS